MRIAIVKQKITTVPQDSFAGYIETMLEEVAISMKYEVLFWVKGMKADAIPANAVIIIETDASSRFGLKWFYEVHLPSIIKKTGTELLVHLDGCLSLAIKQPQWLLASGASSQAATTARQTYIEKKAAAFFSKAAGIISPAESIKTALAATVTDHSKVIVIPPAAKEFYKMVEWEQKELLKAEYSAGNEYFLVHHEFTSQEELLQLLKAFSVFKKWQQSGMKLLIVGGPLFEESSKSKEKFTSYKYRDDVKWIDHLPEERYAQMLACSYTFIHIDPFGNDLISLAQAAASGAAVIANATPLYKEIYGEALIYNEDNDPQTLGNNMVRVYKNEQLRNLNIRSAMETARSFVYDEQLKKLQQLFFAGK